MRHILFILNPVAGSKKLAINAKLISSYFENSGILVSTEYSKYAGHAKELIGRYKIEGITDVIAVGGDGSFSDVASCLIDSNISAGVVPTGSGNGIARHVGIPCHSIEALDIIKKGVYQYVDVGKMNDLLFFSNSGLGIDAHIIQEYDKTSSRGWFTYGRLGVREYFRFKPKPMVINWGEGPVNVEPALLSIAISNQYGYNFKIAPDASMIDALFDIQAIPMLPPHKAVSLSWHMMTARYYYHNKGIRLYAKHLSVSLAAPTNIQCDGESISVGKHLEYTLLPRALRLIVPHQATEKI